MSSSNIDTIGQSNEGSTALSNTLSPLKPEVDDDNYDDDPQAFSLIRFFGVCYVFRSKSRCNGKVNVGSVAATLAIPLIFMGEYGFTRGVAELPYLSMLVDIFIGSFVCTLFEKRFNKAMAKNNGKPIPEERLSPMIFGSIFFAIGLFLLAWSGSYPEHVHWIVPTIGSSFIGFGLITIFLPCMNYIIDCYLMFAASAMAANTFLRSMFGGAFPLFARQMFVNMKIQWVGILLGCVSVVLLPVPFLFYSYGRKIREK